MVYLALTTIIIFRWLFHVCLNAVIEGEVFVSLGNLFQARATEGSKG